MGNWFGSGWWDQTDGNASSGVRNQGSVHQTLIFPDPALPCKFGRTCRRGASCNFSHDETSLKKFLARLSSAKQSLDVCVFTLTLNEIASVLLNLHQHNVRVRIISDGEQANAQGSDVQRLARAGIPVRLHHSPNDHSNPAHMHHKFAIIDDKCVVTGSFNWTRQAVLANRENVVITDMPGFRGEFRNEFNRLWREYAAHEIRDK